MSVKVYNEHEKILIYPVASDKFITLDKILVPAFFMKIPIYTSVVSVFIQVKNHFPSEYGWTSLNLTRSSVVLTRNHKTKMLKSKLYL